MNGLLGKKKESHKPAQSAEVMSGKKKKGRLTLYKLKVKTHFNAAHFLRGYPGNCSRIHGHTFSVEATISGENLDELGMLIDFVTVKEAMKVIISKQFDHWLINEFFPFDKNNPTAENIAAYIFEQLKYFIPPKHKLVSIMVWESPDCSVEYTG